MIQAMEKSSMAVIDAAGEPEGNRAIEKILRIRVEKSNPIRCVGEIEHEMVGVR